MAAVSSREALVASARAVEVPMVAVAAWWKAGVELAVVASMGSRRGGVVSGAGWCVYM